MEIVVFLAQWTLILQILWISCVLIPFTILSIVFFVLNWLIIDPFTNFLITGSFNQQIITSQITWNSPLVIITIIGLILAFIALIIFIINYFVKNISNISLIAIPKQLLMLFSFIGIVIIIPFGFVVFSLFTKFFGSIVQTLFANNNTFDHLNIAEFKNVLQNLLNFSNNSLINQNVWNDAWSTIIDSNQLIIKDSIFTKYNALITALNNLNLNSFINNLINNTNDLNKLKDLLSNNPNLTHDLTNVINLANDFKNELVNLNSLSIDPSILEKINLNFGTFNQIQNVEEFINNWQLLLKNQIMISNISLDSNGELIQTSNIAFMLYYATTGLYVNSIAGIIANFTFVQGLFQSNGIFELTKSIALSTVVGLGIAKAVSTLISMLIYRWFVFLAGIPTGYIAAARITNDHGQILKIWFREILTSIISIFVITLCLQITYLLINAIQFGLTNNQIVIDGIQNVWIGPGIQIDLIQIVFILFTIILIYVNNSFITKTLESFNASATFKDNVSSSIVNEYNSSKNLRKNNKSSVNSIKKSIYKNDRFVNWKKSGFTSAGFKANFGSFKPPRS